MALDAAVTIKKIFFTGLFGKKIKGQKILRLLSKNPAEIYEITDHILYRLADTEAPQGIIAEISYAPLTLERLYFDNQPLLVVIDGVQDPGNAGAIIRTSDAAGADAVIFLAGSCNPFNSKTIRATAGSIFNLPIIHSESTELLKWLRQKKIRLAVTSINAEKTVFTSELEESIALVFGNEAHGVSERLKSNADLLLNIPIYGKAESLNVAVSAAICLYECVRQRKFREINYAFRIKSGGSQNL